jgi:hypothetical protein
MIQTSISSGWLVGLALLVFTVFIIPMKSCSNKGCTTITKQTVLLALERRDSIGSLLELNGFTSGAELGVQVGRYSTTVMSGNGVEKSQTLPFYSLMIVCMYFCAERHFRSYNTASMAII